MWFATSAGLLSVAANDEKIEKEVNIFLSKFSGKHYERGKVCYGCSSLCFYLAHYWTLAFRTTKIYSILRKALLFKNGISTSLLFLARNLNPRARRDEEEINWSTIHFIFMH